MSTAVKIREKVVNVQRTPLTFRKPGELLLKTTFKKIHGPQAPKEMKDGTRLFHGTVPFLKMGVAILFQHQYLLQHSCGQNQIHSSQMYVSVRMCDHSKCIKLVCSCWLWLSVCPRHRLQGLSADGALNMGHKTAQNVTSSSQRADSWYRVS